MVRPGRVNGITDVDGILVGHFTDVEGASGATVVLCLEGAVAGVDVRGSAPGTRETDLLAPQNLVERAQAVVLCGGSVYGLLAVDGVVSWLAEKAKGFPVGHGQVVPIVPAAVLFDLGRGRSFRPPVSREWGILACEAATSGPVLQGNVGAGTGAVAGGIKGGIGSASEIISGQVVVGALVAVNSFGSPVDPATGLFWELRLVTEDELGGMERRAVSCPATALGSLGQHTTLGVVATNAALTKAQAMKVAQMAHDGLARAIRPAHTMFDGDTIFCLSTGQVRLSGGPGDGKRGEAWVLSEIGRAAADTVARSVMRAMARATSAYGFPALRDLPAKESV